ncbi:hypothetical protein Pelo_43 [Pelomyxa schiedti]|nr:hypothetical protein Pelo_43 [Pelomyxa schiedti]
MTNLEVVVQQTAIVGLIARRLGTRDMCALQAVCKSFLVVFRRDELWAAPPCKGKCPCWIKALVVHHFCQTGVIWKYILVVPIAARRGTFRGYKTFSELNILPDSTFSLSYEKEFTDDYGGGSSDWAEFSGAWSVDLVPSSSLASGSWTLFDSRESRGLVFSLMMHSGQHGTWESGYPRDVTGALEVETVRLVLCTQPCRLKPLEASEIRIPWFICPEYSH